MSVVLDASAILAMLLNEPGAEVVVPLVADSIISSVNLAEVIAKIEDRGGSDAQTSAILALLLPRTQPLTAQQGVLAGKLRRQTRRVQRSCPSLSLRKLSPMPLPGTHPVSIS